MQRQSAKMGEASPLAAIGATVRAIRQERGMSQEALADEAGLDRSHMGRIERGERNVTLLNLVKVAEALRYPLSSLFERAGL